MSLFVAQGDVCQLQATLSSRGASSPSSPPPPGGNPICLPGVPGFRGRALLMRAAGISVPPVCVCPRVLPGSFTVSFVLMLTYIRRSGPFCRRAPVEPSVVGRPGRQTPSTGHQALPPACPPSSRVPRAPPPTACSRGRRLAHVSVAERPCRRSKRGARTLIFLLL